MRPFPVNESVNGPLTVRWRNLGLDIVPTKYGLELSQQRLVNSIYEQAKPHIDKFNVQPARVPIRYQRLKTS